MGEAGLGLPQPLLRERAVLDLGQDLAHAFAHAFVHDPRTAPVVAPLRGVRDRVAHPGQAALVDQVDDELELVQALEVRDLGLVPGLHQRVEPRLDERGDAAAQHRLLTEQIGLGLLLERRLEDARSSGSDAGAVGERSAERGARSIMLDRDERGGADAFLVGPPDQVTRPLRGDHRDVDVGGWLDRPEVHRESVREHQHVAGLEVRCDLRGVDGSVRRVGEHDHDDVGLRDRLACRPHGQSGLLGLGPGRRAFAEPDPDVVARIPQVLRVRVPLAPEPQDRDPLPREDRRIGIRVVVDRRHR